MSVFALFYHIFRWDATVCDIFPQVFVSLSSPNFKKALDKAPRLCYDNPQQRIVRIHTPERNQKKMAALLNRAYFFFFSFAFYFRKAFCRSTAEA